MYTSESRYVLGKGLNLESYSRDGVGTFNPILGRGLDSQGKWVLSPVVTRLTPVPTHKIASGTLFVACWPKHFPIGSVYVWYIYLHLASIYGKVVVKHTVRPMDPSSGFYVENSLNRPAPGRRFRSIMSSQYFSIFGF